MTNMEREVGKLEARMETVEQELQAIRADVREIRDALVSAKAGWKVLTLAMAGAASLGALAARWLPKIIE